MIFNNNAAKYSFIEKVPVLSSFSEEVIISKIEIRKLYKNQNHQVQNPSKLKFLK
jgi:hypothetical protein